MIDFESVFVLDSSGFVGYLLNYCLEYCGFWPSFHKFTQAWFDCLILHAYVEVKIINKSPHSPHCRRLGVSNEQG